jgi:MarR family transcriptional regulator for hemolysin
VRTHISPFDRLSDAVGALARRRYQAADKAFATVGLNHTEARLLTLLQQAGGSAPQDHLAAQMFIDRTNAGRALKALERRALVRRRSHETDKRANVVAITTAGRAAVRALGRVRRSIARDLFSGLTVQEADAAATLLEKALR